MSKGAFRVGDVVRLSGTERLALVVARAYIDGLYPVVEVRDDYEYHDPHNFQPDMWGADDMELLIPCEESGEFPAWKGGER